VVNIEDGREVVVGNEGQHLTIQCTSYGGYPAPSLTWYNRSVSTSNELATTNNGILQSNSTNTVTLQHKFTPTRSDDRKRIICRSYYPQADSTHIASNVKSALLYLSCRYIRTLATMHLQDLRALVYGGFLHVFSFFL
jgi:hypothetical protein